MPHKQNMLSGALAQSRMLMGGSLGPQRRKTLEQRVVVSASSLFYLLPSAHMRAVTGLFLFKLNNGRRCVEAWRGV